MSAPFLIAAIVDSVLTLALTLHIRNRYNSSLTSVAEKSAGALYFYRASLRRLAAAPGLDSFVTLAHYAGLHLLVPLWGFAIWLHSDGNFLVVIAWAVWAVQLVQRLFPGSDDEPAVRSDLES